MVQKNNKNRGYNMKITIVDPKQRLIDIVNEYFSDTEEVTAVVGDFRSYSADALVSPANSFGIMDGGIDALYVEHLGKDMQKKLQSRIIKKYHGELPVGMSLDIEIDNPQYKWLISAPTMRVPQNISTTDHVYLAFRSMLLTAMKNNSIKTIVTPVFGTGIGKMNYEVAATQMKLAYLSATKLAEIPSFDKIDAMHNRMYNPSAW